MLDNTNEYYLQFLKLRESNDLNEITKYYNKHKDNIDLSYGNNFLLNISSYDGSAIFLIFLLDIIDIKTENLAFYMACVYDNMANVKIIHEKYKEKNIDKIISRSDLYSLLKIRPNNKSIKYIMENDLMQEYNYVEINSFDYDYVDIYSLSKYHNDITYKKNEELKSQINNIKNEKCIICFEKTCDTYITHDKNIHPYHSSCIKKWYNVKNTCPMCRKTSCKITTLC